MAEQVEVQRHLVVIAAKALAEEASHLEGVRGRSFDLALRTLLYYVDALNALESNASREKK